MQNPIVVAKPVDFSVAIYEGYAAMKMLEPWLLCAALTPERLFRLAQIAVRVRERLAELHEPEQGDDSWTFGCRAYKWLCFAYQRFAESGDDPGMKVDVDVLRCQMSFDGEPITFYRGDADHPPARALRRGLKSISQVRLPFFEEQLSEEDEGWFWLLAIEPKVDGTVLSVAMVQANAEGEVRNFWPIPLDAPVTVVSSLGAAQTDAVKLPPPLVGHKLETDGAQVVEEGEESDSDANPLAVDDDAGQ